MSELNTPNTENSIEETPGIPEISLQLEVMDTVEAPVDDTLSIAGQAADAKATGDAIDALESSLEQAIAALFPVGAIYVSTSSTAPAFYGTWVETTIPVTHGDLYGGYRSYVDGTGTGTLHFWRRTA
jgi:hypothetical protein